MQDLEQMISIYHTAFILFLVLAILFLLVSVFEFFKFDIRGIFDMRSGRGARRSIKKMEEINEQTGKLRNYTPNTTGEIPGRGRVVGPATAEKLQKISANKTGKSEALVGSGAPQTLNEKIPMEVDGQETALLNNGSEETALLDGENEATTLLKNNDGNSDAETTILQEATSETTVLGVSQEQGTQQTVEQAIPRAFKIEKEIMWVHTDEVL